MQPCPNCPPEFTTWSDEDHKTLGYCMSCLQYFFEVRADGVHIRIGNLTTIKSYEEFTRK